jgi:hypothetical protein
MMGKEREDIPSLVHIAAVKHHRKQDVAQCCSRAASVVCISQVLFLTLGYTHQLAFEGELRLEKIHVSGMLDNETRSLLCGMVAIISGIALLAGEISRPVSAFLPLRIVLAGATGVGILLVCLVRESRNNPLHVVFACLAFGSGIALIWVVLYTTNRVYKGWARFPAMILLLVCAVTGVGQGLNIAKLWKLPTTWLAIAEAIMILLFGYSILTVSGDKKIIMSSFGNNTVREVRLSSSIVPLKNRLIKRKKNLSTRLLRRAPLWLCLLRCSSWLHIGSIQTSEYVDLRQRPVPVIFLV